MKQKKEYMDLAVYAVEQGKKEGADGAEAFISDTESVEINVSGRQIEQVNAVKEAGIGLRLLKDRKLAFGSTNELSRESVQKMVKDLMAKVVFHTPDEFNVIAAKEEGLADWSARTDLITYDPRIAEIPVQEKIKRALAVEEAALGFSPEITGSMFAGYQDGTNYLYLANSNGVSGCFPNSGCGGGAEMSAAKGEDHQSGSFFQTFGKYADFKSEEIGRKAAERAVKMLGARPIPSMEVPMVVAPEVGTELLSFIVGMLSADEVQKGRSLFAGKINAQVASPSFNMVDDGKLKGGLSTAPVDAEGVPRQTTNLVVNGVLKSYLYDCYSAKKGNTKSTGNRTRDGYRSSGGIGTTNLFLRPGTTKPEEIMNSVGRGFYLTSAIGLFAGINSASGDFSIPVAGFVIEKGKISYPVRGISIGGNLFDFLKSVDKVGSDLTWFQSIGSPTFLIKSIKIGGVQDTAKK